MRACGATVITIGGEAKGGANSDSRAPHASVGVHPLKRALGPFETPRSLPRDAPSMDTSAGLILEPVEAQPPPRERPCPPGPRPTALGVIATVLVVGFLWWFRPVLVPLAVAWLLKVALTPALRRLRAWGLGAMSAALLLTLTGGGLLVTGAMFTVEPLAVWLEELPEDVETVRERIAEAQGNMAALSESVESIKSLADDGDAPIPVEVKRSEPPVLAMLDTARLLIAQLLLVAILTFFLLAGDGRLETKLKEVQRSEAGRQRATRTLHAVETHCARYLGTITVINIALGLCVAGACATFGLESPLLWGALAAVLNFIPFIGAAIGISLVFFAGLMTIGELPDAALPAMAYAFLTCVEGMAVTPAIVGRQIRLSPVATVIWLVTWTWLWGLAGAFLAFPMLAAAVLICRNVPEWRPLATLVEA